MNSFVAFGKDFVQCDPIVFFVNNFFFFFFFFFFC
jgi:hypothetical protein